MAFIETPVPSPLRFTMTQKKKLAAQPETPKNKKKVRASNGATIRNGGRGGEISFH
jgi:hypothetical protein